jgi:hypothetical protein
MPVLWLGLMTPAFLSTGCGDDALPGGDCAADITAKVEGFQASVEALVTLSGELKADVAVSCAAIASDLGAADAPTIDMANITDEDVKAACASASAAIDAEISAGASFSLIIEGGKCEVAASAQFDCEAKCDVSGECTPGSIDVRCEPGQLSGSCSGECSGECTAEANATVECSGECSGSCSGMCQGTCEATGTSGQCDGACTGTCEGTCSGSCTIDASATASCSGSCKGSCDVDFEAPSCEGEVTAPECNLDADCQAGCSGQAELKAECTPPTIKLEADAGVKAELVATLEANLPKLFTVFELRGQAVVEAAADIAGKAVGVASAAVAIPGCALKFGADLAGEFSAAAEASVSVSVSVDASASAGGSAQSG